MTRIERARRRRIRERTVELRRELAGLDFLATGTLHTRTKVCGKPSCPCATDRAARHGPYHEWVYREEGRSVCRMLSAEQAQLIAEAIANYRQLKELLARWQRETATEILCSEPPAEE